MTPNQFKLLETLRNNGGWNTEALLKYILGGRIVSSISACVARGWIERKEIGHFDWVGKEGEPINYSIRLTSEGEAAWLREQGKVEGK